MFAANSEVSMKAIPDVSRVAVAVTTCPVGTAAVSVALKLALPLALVTTSTKPR